MCYFINAIASPRKETGPSTSHTPTTYIKLYNIYKRLNANPIIASVYSIVFCFLAKVKVMAGETVNFSIALPSEEDMTSVMINKTVKIVLITNSTVRPDAPSRARDENPCAQATYVDTSRHPRSFRDRFRW